MIKPSTKIGGFFYSPNCTPLAHDFEKYQEFIASDISGFIGVARDLMHVGKDFDKTLSSIKRHRAELPAHLHQEAAIRLGELRVNEMDDCLAAIQTDHFELL